ncbi:ABC transporter permease [Abyssalbus ytuae]|uniref:ABC transporter permease n=1 Tax=Abyssalbus ytuae TaxID=2926907 RepID=A0A9E6ZKU8_9FLAO|nr:FtsX-like permease family protein [Abyssalbus ytuae]UOB16070.1 ABC transporter permease [Abyssalbus ytuae]
MLRNYFKIAWRNLLKNRLYFVINIFGLSAALIVSFLISLWVNDELKTDKFHENEAQLYSIKRTIPLEGDAMDVYNSISYPLLKNAKQQIPEILKYMIIGHTYEDNLTVDDTDLRASGTFTNADFFSGFSFPIITGDISQLDKKPESIAISENLAKRFWGSEWRKNAIGSSIHIHDNGDFNVIAVFKNLPDNSSIQNDFYYSFKSYLKNNPWLLEWNNNRMQGVFLLREDADADLVSTKIKHLFQANISGTKKEGCFLQKFSESYLYNQYNDKAQVSGGRIEYVRTFTAAVIFLLIISSINFINLSTAYSTKRAAEVGIRKAIGARKNTLVKQFMAETGIITLISIIIASLFTLIFIKPVNNFTGKNLHIDFTQPGLWISLFLAFIIITILSGSYPAFVLSSFTPALALKGKGNEKKNTISFRKGLVVIQFGLSIIMILAAIVINKQIDYINKKNLGITKNHIISIHQDQKLTQKYTVLRNELLSSEGIQNVTLAGPSPLNMGASSSGLAWPGKSIEQENIEFSLLWTAYNFPEVFDVPVVDGSYFREASKDSTNIVINQKAAEIMNIQDPVGKIVELWGKKKQIIGVLKDFHNRSLYEPIQPSVFLLDANNAGMMFIRLESDKTKEALASVQSVFLKILPEVPLHYEFVDEKYAEKYKSETLTSTITNYFALISVIISCLGLFGLTTFMAEQRTKEIGIRKVLGASVAGITTILSKDFLKLVLLSIVIALPIAYYLMHQWLQEFAYKIDISWQIFVLTSAITIIIAFITISFQFLKAAIANPVKSLKTE